MNPSVIEGQRAAIPRPIGAIQMTGSRWDPTRADHRAPSGGPLLGAASAREGRG
jgi:hypothetical protein